MAGAPDSGDDLLGLQRRRGAGLLDIGHRRRGIDVLWDPVHDEGGKCLESGRGSSPAHACDLYTSESPLQVDLLESDAAAAAAAAAAARRIEQVAVARLGYTQPAAEE